MHGGKLQVLVSIVPGRSTDVKLYLSTRGNNRELRYKRKVLPLPKQYVMRVWKNWR
jgi:hypothetical protein